MPPLILYQSYRAPSLIVHRIYRTSPLIVHRMSNINMNIKVILVSTPVNSPLQQHGQDRDSIKYVDVCVCMVHVILVQRHHLSYDSFSYRAIFLSCMLYTFTLQLKALFLLNVGQNQFVCKEGKNLLSSPVAL